VPREKAVCFIYQPEKPRRCAGLGIEALGIVKHFMPDVTVYLYGSRSAGRVWFEHENLGILSLEACNRLYNRCRVGLCISTTNPSRIPFEMMAAGLPVVEVYRDNTLYDFPEEAVALCEPTPESLAQGLMRLLSDTQQTESMSRHGSDFMRHRPLVHGLDQFRRTGETLLNKGTPVEKHPLPLYRRGPIKAEPRALGAGPTAIPYYGRLAFLPPPLRKVVRSGYRLVSRLIS
jgi:hypothetical protein